MKNQTTSIILSLLTIAVIIAATTYVAVNSSPSKHSETEPITIETDTYIARIHGGCTTPGCKSHLVIDTKIEPVKRKDGFPIFIFACDLCEEKHPAGDDILDQISYRYVPSDHPLKDIGWDEVQKIFNDLRFKEAQSKVAVEATDQAAQPVEKPKENP